jgi:hypothetical protein
MTGEKKKEAKEQKKRKTCKSLVTITPNKQTNPLTTQSILDSTIVGIEGLNNSPKNSVEKFSPFSQL